MDNKDENNVQVEEQSHETENHIQTQEERKKKIWAIIGSIASIVLVAIFAGLSITGIVVIAPPKYKPIDLINFADRLAFTLKYFVLHAIWLLVAFSYVTKGRARSKAFNPLDGN